MPNPLLTIAIPTYKRAKFLDICLDSITKQIDANDERIELMVSNNCSPDNTTEIVKKYINQGFKINYIINKENIGPDANFAQCFKLAKGNFIWIFGDDDILDKNGLQLILNIIVKNPMAGLIHLNCWYNNLSIPAFKNNEFICVENKYEFIRYVHFWLTFITANIVNKNYIDWEDLLKDINTNLNQVHIYLEALIKAPTNVVVCKKMLLGGGLENTGGYDLFKVFGTNFNKVMDEVSIKTTFTNFKQIINNQLLKNFFPNLILFFKKSVNNFQKSNPHKVLYPIYKGYLNYWVFCFPLIFIPNYMGRRYYKYLKILNKLIFKLYVYKKS